MEIGFSLGSNLGDRITHLTRAKNEIVTACGGAVLAQSPLYETEPIDVHQSYQHLFFLNAVLIIESDKTLSYWSVQLNEIETRLGRVRGEDKNAPRTIDIDLLYLGYITEENYGFSVPHPRWATRRFVVQPFCDIRPHLVLPNTDKTVQDTLRTLGDTSRVTKIETAW